VLFGRLIVDGSCLTGARGGVVRLSAIFLSGELDNSRVIALNVAQSVDKPSSF